MTKEKPKELDEKKQQEIMMKLQMYEQQVQQIQQQLQMIEQGIAELHILDSGLSDLKGKKDKEILAPVGRGMFVKAKLLSEDLIVDIGGKNFVTKSIPDAKKLIEEQLTKLDDVKTELEKAMKDVEKDVLGELQDR